MKSANELLRNLNPNNNKIGPKFVQQKNWFSQNRVILNGWKSTFIGQSEPLQIKKNLSNDKFQEKYLVPKPISPEIKVNLHEIIKFIFLY